MSMSAFLHVLDVRRRVVDHALAVAKERAQASDSIAGPEAAAEEAVLVQLLEPLGVADVGLPAGHVLHVARVHEDDLEASLLQDLEDRYPVDARRLHRDCRDAGRRQPVGELVQVGREAAKRAHGLLVTIGCNSGDVERRSNVEAGGIRVNLLKRCLR
jgi:hypothetical protein